MKVAEFMKLNQGTRSMTEYLHAFNNLSCYATDFVDTDTKKIASFKRGLSPKMLKTMGTSNRATFNDFISDCLTQENNNNLYSASKNRKRSYESGPSRLKAPMTYRPPYRPPALGGKYKAPQKKGQNAPPQQRNQKPFRVVVPQNKTRQGSAAGAATYVKGPCYNYGHNGHFAKYCPHPKKQQATYPARVHHTTIDDIPEGEPMIAGMFSIN
jgi:hypothetical protein